VAEALDLEAELRLRGRTASARLHHLWADIGRRVMDPSSSLYKDLIEDIEITGIPLDPRTIDQHI
jgi:predicted NAD/FAD-dependent oxidoreductase